MPYIVLPYGEKRYKPLTENIFKILKDFSNENISAEALIFNGQKLPTNFCLCDIDNLREKHNIYLIQKSIAKNQITITEIEKYRVFHVTFNDNEKIKVRAYCQNSKNVKNLLKNNPNLCGKQEAIDVLSDYTLFLEFMLEAVNTVISERQNLAELPGSLITTDMVQRALDILTNTHTPISSENSNLESASSSNNHLSMQSTLQASMEIVPNYNELQKTYVLQLNQMHEFGFTDDNENIRALLISDGNLERALELIISLRE